jgi:hypothetical protein
VIVSTAGGAALASVTSSGVGDPAGTSARVAAKAAPIKPIVSAGFKAMS